MKWPNEMKCTKLTSKMFLEGGRSIHRSQIVRLSLCLCLVIFQAFLWFVFWFPSPDWTWHPTSWRKYLRTRCSCESPYTRRWRGLLSRRWCWVLAGTPCTATASWCGFADWPERTTWRPALHLETSPANTSGPYERSVKKQTRAAAEAVSSKNAQI